jgi:hypothetical protein
MAVERQFARAVGALARQLDRIDLDDRHLVLTDRRVLVRRIGDGLREGQAPHRQGGSG